MSGPICSAQNSATTGGRGLPWLPGEPSPTVLPRSRAGCHSRGGEGSPEALREVSGPGFICPSAGVASGLSPPCKAGRSAWLGLEPPLSARSYFVVLNISSLGHHGPFGLLSTLTRHMPWCRAEADLPRCPRPVCAAKRFPPSKEPSAAHAVTKATSKRAATPPLPGSAITWTASGQPARPSPTHPDAKMLNQKGPGQARLPAICKGRARSAGESGSPGHR